MQTTSIPECIACCYFGVFEPNLLANVGTIENALLPHYDRAETTGTREERLSEILLCDAQKQQLKKTILLNSKLFILDDKELGELKVSEAHFEVIDSEPVRRPLCRQPENARNIITTMVDDMLKRDITGESTAVYLSPIVLVSNPDGSKRMCIDYRSVNQKNKQDIHPLPRLDEMVEDSAGKKFYFSLDMKDAYFQVKLDDKSRDVTTFSDGLNLYKFKILSFGLFVSPATFTRKMQEVLRPLLKNGWCRNYLDDVVLWADSLTSYC